jgi:hypothetical protein
VDATWDDFRFTIGSSADDAGIGELDDRVVLAVNPSGWPSDLQAFYEHYYPGVKYAEVQAGTAAGLRSAILARV